MNYTPYSQYAQPYLRQDYTQPQTAQNYAPTLAQPGFICRPVTSREEAVAVQADYFSPGTFMPDLGHGVVYMKRFNPNTGASDFYTFALQTDAPAPEEPVYATAQEVAELREEIARLKKGKAVKKNDPDEE